MKGRQAAGIDGDFRQLHFILCAKHGARQIPLSRHGGGGGLNGAVDCLHNRSHGGVGEERTRGRSYCTPAPAQSKALSDKGVGMKTTRWSQTVGRALLVCILCDMDHWGADAFNL